jgi:hypothetical protein
MLVSESASEVLSDSWPKGASLLTASASKTHSPGGLTPARRRSGVTVKNLMSQSDEKMEIKKKREV